MFPKAGSTQPEIRLKGFSGGWDSYSIFSLAQNQKLNNGVFNDQNKVGKGYKLINVLDMYIETSIDESKLTLLDLDRKEFEQNKVKYGDIFFTRSSLVKEGIAFSNVYLGHSNDITYDGHLIKLSPNLELVDPIFLNYCLKSSKVRTQLILGGKSTTMTTIGQQEVGETTVGLPTMSEQLKIGQFFKQLDETLTLQQQQLQTLKNLKQAFLEKMFV
ncbi:TPA: restriction endonuclease subunit S [Acinetobacter baumannii]|nr:restriction endonuclease subunit S [Acinetobacter baumannii]